VVRPWSCRVIYYFDTPVLGKRHQSFGRVKFLAPLPGRVWSHTLSGRLCRVSSSFSENMAEEDNQSLHNENNENIRVRILRDHMNPTRTSAPSCIVFPPDASHFNFKPDIIQLLPSFYGLDL
jgi:hypothetical protein